MVVSKKAVEFFCYSFIDNTGLIHTSQDSKARDADILKEMQEALNHWEDSIRATDTGISD
jgi:hypothetical protein